MLLKELRGGNLKQVASAIYGNALFMRVLEFGIDFVKKNVLFIKIIS
jgi:hypothetical protein